MNTCDFCNERTLLSATLLRQDQVVLKKKVENYYRRHKLDWDPKFRFCSRCLIEISDIEDWYDRTKVDKRSREESIERELE